MPTKHHQHQQRHGECFASGCVKKDLKKSKMAVVTSKTGTQSEPFNVFKQKLGKQTSFKGFKQHFSSITTINHDKSTKTNKANFVATTEEETVDEKRGFTPSDVLNDPSKKEFLTQLSKRMWMEKEKFLSKRKGSDNITLLIHTPLTYLHFQLHFIK